MKITDTATPKEIPCMRCRRQWTSPDPSRRRLCPACAKSGIRYGVYATSRAAIIAQRRKDMGR